MQHIDVDVETRRRRRASEVGRLLGLGAVDGQALAPQTVAHLNEWARQVFLCRDQPSANWASAIINLGKAVEAELAATLGQKATLTYLMQQSSIGAKIARLRSNRIQVEEALGHSDASARLDRLLAALGSIRPIRNDSSHGDAPFATPDDASAAELVTVEVLAAIRACDVGP